MSRFRINRKRRIIAAIAISGGFFIAELVVGYRTKSLALIADAFHYMNDLIGFAVALIALVVSERKTPPPKSLPFGWNRAQVLGAFFNGVFLLALGVSILLQAIERFTQLPNLKDPILILIMGCIGLGLNMIVLSFLHEPHHQEHTRETTHPAEESRDPLSPTNTPIPTTSSPKHHNHTHPLNINMLGVLLHVLTDALNNLSVIIAALIIWKSPSPNRLYADPAIGIFIALTITLSAVPLCRRAGQILMESAPAGVDVEFVRGEMLKVPRVQEVSNLLVWQLDQTTTLATAHITITEDSISSFASTADAIGLRLQQFGIRSVALQPTTTKRRPYHEVQEGMKIS
ncbi:cation diffusion facilitator family transporter [Colletotrichum paranaense]|uniref:Cation diffusion facilitator family transporter n=1 Tax=Colletotrichum paranaense TaxID=1914294 RepID=A0ABQ9SX43_9PEZI|nr:cation diffusion facilitator family transporter [Colletotrichum paranaense]KAK1544092.1 cation diffusion facilitator family transporter [Colletotrichum paranaense]